MSTKGIKTANELIQIIKQEISLMEEFRCNEEELRDALKRSDWASLSDHMERMGQIADWIDSTEQRRRALYSALCAEFGADETIPFYQAIMSLPEELRSECAELYRSLKFTTVKIKGVTWSLDSHIRSVSDTMQAVLNELFPYRKGKLYSRHGKARTADTEPLVVNQHL
ncbi:flagellar export chaperone FlgN [Marispirochaeta sp.]|jgi:flagellar biosynthesis/type III secretory pathway chaperone|uniref:flagellar export chaperone FlgN n=1 Tax=Marispirochaeta sp. TaxID=2038653 RepID=UPI0029C7384C|nr:flagellar export chaperone FlgN [Marispirochaeta sp.]